jgi:hypothetical protein
MKKGLSLFAKCVNGGDIFFGSFFAQEDGHGPTQIGRGRGGGACSLRPLTLGGGGAGRYFFSG